MGTGLPVVVSIRGSVRVDAAAVATRRSWLPTQTADEGRSERVANKGLLYSVTLPVMTESERCLEIIWKRKKWTCCELGTYSREFIGSLGVDPEIARMLTTHGRVFKL